MSRPARRRLPQSFPLLPGNEEPMQVLSLRLRRQDVEELDRRAERDHGGNRSAAVRAWLEAPGQNP